MVKSAVLLNRINKRKIIKNLGQFVSIIIITLLAVCLAVGLNSSAQTLEKKLDTLMESSNFADGILYGLIEEEDFNQLASITDEQQRRLELSATVEKNIANLLVTDGISTINLPYTDNYNGGVYINEYLSKELDLNTGDKFTISVDMSILLDEYSEYITLLDFFVADGKSNVFNNNFLNLEFEITGVMYHIEGVCSEGPVIMEYSIFQDKLIEVVEENFNQSDIVCEMIPFITSEIYNAATFKGDYDTVKNFEYFNNENFFVFDSNYNAGLLQMTNDIDQAYQLTYVFPVIFILVSILIIITTISQLIFKERLNIATLKSIGISNKEIYLHYILLTISLCMIGGVIGALIGPMIIPNVMGIKYGLLYYVPNTSNVYDIITISYNILFFVIASTIVSYFILRKSVNTLPATLIRNTGGQKFKKSRLKISSWSMKIALRNISQNVFRSLMVIIGVGGCASLFITGFGIDDTLNHTVDVEVNHNFIFDINVKIDYTDEILNDIEEIDTVTYVEKYTIVNSAIEHDIFNMTNIYIIEEDTKVFNNGDFNGVYLSSKIADNLGLVENDIIEFKINNIKYEYKIDYIIETAFSHGVFIKDNNFNLNATNVWIDTDNQSYVASVLEEFEEVKYIGTMEEFLISVDESLGPISIIKITLQIFAFLLGVVVLYNLALLNYRERNRDIATLKVLGLTNVEIAKSLIYEMMILAVLGGLVGISLGYPMLVLLLSINEVDFITYIYNLTPLSYLLTFTFTTLTALVINLILFKQINNIKMVESLKSVE